MLRVVVGPLGTNCYIVYDKSSKDAVLVDPGARGERILRAVEDAGLVVKAVALTHAHFDHFGGLGKILERWSVPVYVGNEDAAYLRDPGWQAEYMEDPMPEVKDLRTLSDGDVLLAGTIRLNVLSTPGHTEGSLSYYYAPYLFSGDLVFPGSVGRSDLPGGDEDTLVESISSKIACLPEDTIVFPGHGESTTIGKEKRQNPYFLS